MNDDSLPLSILQCIAYSYTLPSMHHPTSTRCITSPYHTLSDTLHHPWPSLSFLYYKSLQNVVKRVVSHHVLFAHNHDYLDEGCLSLSVARGMHHRQSLSSVAGKCTTVVRGMHRQCITITLDCLRNALPSTSQWKCITFALSFSRDASLSIFHLLGNASSISVSRGMHRRQCWKMHHHLSNARKMHPSTSQWRMHHHRSQFLEGASLLPFQFLVSASPCLLDYSRWQGGGSTTTATVMTAAATAMTAAATAMSVVDGKSATPTGDADG